MRLNAYKRRFIVPANSIKILDGDEFITSLKSMPLDKKDSIERIG